MDDGSEPVASDEILYRRIAPAFMRAGDPFPSPLAFTPNRNDSEGLSIYRAKYTRTIAEVAYNDRGTSYYVAIFRAADLLAAGINITPSPDHAGNKIGHAHLPGITHANRKDAAVVNWINLLTTRLSQTYGPFPGIPPSVAEQKPDPSQSGPATI